MVAMTATRSVVNSFKFKALFTGKARLGLGRMFARD
jgi:hypothetical protein